MTVLFLVAGFYLGLSGTMHDRDMEQALAALTGLLALGAFLLRQWGKFSPPVADPSEVLPAQGLRRAAPADDGDPRPGRRHRGARRHRGLEPRDGRADPRRPTTRRTTPRAATSSRSGSTPARPSPTCCAARTPATCTTSRPRGRPLPRRPRPAPRLVPLVAADGLRARRPRALPRPADARLHGRQPGPQDEQVPRQRHRAAGGEQEARRRDHPAVGAPPPTTRATSPATTRSSPASSTPTAASATRCASCSPTPATSTPRRTRCRRRAAGDRPLGAGARRAVPGRGAGALQRLRVPPGGRQAAGVLLGRPGRVLPRRAEGPPLHHRAGCLARRSAQTALWHITHAMLRWMAPFLSFTAEEAWKVFGGRRRRSSPRPTGRCAAAPTRRCSPSGRRIREVRDAVNKEIEACAPPAQVGCSLQANVRSRRRPTTRRCWPRWART